MTLFGAVVSICIGLFAAAITFLAFEVRNLNARCDRHRHVIDSLSGKEAVTDRDVASISTRLEKLELIAKLEHRKREDNVARPRGWRAFLNEMANGEQQMVEAAEREARGE